MLDVCTLHCVTVLILQQLLECDVNFIIRSQPFNKDDQEVFRVLVVFRLE